MAALILITFVLMSLYMMLITKLLQGFNTEVRRQDFVIKAAGVLNHKSRFSIVAAARNEENNIANLINDLKALDYPRNLYEFILSDDESSDRTLEIARKELEKSGLTYRIINGGGGKKASLAKALDVASGELILFTDADCRIPAGWLSAFNLIFASGHKKMVTGPVFFKTGKTVFSQLQALEFASLTAAGAGAVGLGKPVMSNGANMCVRKETAMDVSHIYRSGEPSGDDIFMMLEIKKKYGGDAFAFAATNNAVVETAPPGSLGEFFNQRIRWTRKSRHYKDRQVITTAVIVFLLNLSLVAIFLYAVLFSPAFLLLYVVLSATKTLIDFPLMMAYLTRFKRKKLLWWMFPLQLPYPFYIVFTAIAGQFLPYEWKGR